MKLVKRRKPLLDEPLIPTLKTVKKKYRTGTILGRFARYFSEHKMIRKIFAGNFAAIVVITSFLPSAKAQVVSTNENTIIQSETILVTEKSIQTPLENPKINQGFSFFHPGIDFGAPVGTQIKALKSGIVIEAGYAKDGYGNTVVIDHGGNLISRYAHLSKIEVKVGQIVDINTEIGEVGVTGRTTGPHLHLEIHQDGVAINPLTILPR